MVSDRQIRETADCCLAIMVRHHDAERSSDAKAIMAAEIAVAVGWLVEWGLSLGEAVDLIATKVGESLVSRYGNEVGRRLDAEFMEAFELALASATRSEFTGTYERASILYVHRRIDQVDDRAPTSPWT